MKARPPLYRVRRFIDERTYIEGAEDRMRPRGRFTISPRSIKKREPRATYKPQTTTQQPSPHATCRTLAGKTCKVEGNEDCCYKQLTFKPTTHDKPTFKKPRHGRASQTYNLQSYGPTINILQIIRPQLRQTYLQSQS